MPTNNPHAVKVNSVSGAILKNHPRSWFKRFHLKSELADKLFDKCSDTVILQMVLCGDMEVMAELVLKDDFEDKSRIPEGYEKVVRCEKCRFLDDDETYCKLNNSCTEHSHFCGHGKEKDTEDATTTEPKTAKKNTSKK